MFLPSTRRRYVMTTPPRSRQKIRIGHDSPCRSCGTSCMREMSWKLKSLCCKKKWRITKVKNRKRNRVRPCQTHHWLFGRALAPAFSPSLALNDCLASSRGIKAEEDCRGGRVRWTAASARGPGKKTFTQNRPKKHYSTCNKYTRFTSNLHHVPQLHFLRRSTFTAHLSANETEEKLLIHLDSCRHPKIL